MKSIMFRCVWICRHFDDYIAENNCSGNTLATWLRGYGLTLVPAPLFTRSLLLMMSGRVLGNCLKYRRACFGGDKIISKQRCFSRIGWSSFKVAHYIVGDEQRKYYQRGFFPCHNYDS